VITAITIAKAVAATATAARVGIIADFPVLFNATSMTKITTCKAETPQFREGAFAMFLEGFPRPFTDRETH
jgi:hypothetical protein